MAQSLQCYMFFVVLLLLLDLPAVESRVSEKILSKYYHDSLSKSSNGVPTPTPSHASLVNSTIDSLTFSYRMTISECMGQDMILQLELQSCAVSTSSSTTTNVTIPKSQCPPPHELILKGSQLQPCRCYIASFKFFATSLVGWARRYGNYYFTEGTKPTNKIHFNHSMGYQVRTQADAISIHLPFLGSDCVGGSTRLVTSLFYQNDTTVRSQYANLTVLNWDSCRFADTLLDIEFSKLEPYTYYSVNFQTFNEKGSTDAEWVPDPIRTKPRPPERHQPTHSGSWTVNSATAAGCASDLNHKLYFKFNSSWFIPYDGLSLSRYQMVVVANDSLMSQMSLSKLMNLAENVTYLNSEDMQLPFLVSSTMWNPFTTDRADSCCVLDQNGLCQNLTSDHWVTRHWLGRRSRASFAKVIVIGGRDCSRLSTDKLCVGSLEDRNYSLLIRAYENNLNLSFSNLHSYPIVLSVIVKKIPKNNSGVIAGIVIAVVAGCLLVILICYLIYSNYRSAKERRRKGLTISRRGSARRFHEHTNTKATNTATVTPNNSPETARVQFGLYRAPVVKMVLPGQSRVGIEPPRIPPPIRVENFAGKVSELLRDDGLLCMDELELIDSLSPSIPVKKDLSEEEQIRMPRNRFLNVLPFEFNRVKLSKGPCDYINASYIKGIVRENEYIAAQGPMGVKCTRPNSFGNSREKVETVDDFWLMIWEQKVEVVVMLTQCQEKASSKSAHYWPETIDTQEMHGSFEVRLISEIVKSSYARRILEVNHITEPTVKRRISHLHFVNWADFEAPTEPLQLLDFLDLMRSSLVKGSVSPKLIHCSAGVGRTGTFIALHLILQRLEKSMDYVDVFKCVLELRKQRVFMVKTEKQYALIYRCVNYALSRKIEEMRLKEEDGMGEPTLTRSSSDPGLSGSLKNMLLNNAKPIPSNPLPLPETTVCEHQHVRTATASVYVSNF